MWMAKYAETWVNAYGTIGIDSVHQGFGWFWSMNSLY